jgi:hypothetical protein
LDLALHQCSQTLQLLLWRHPPVTFSHSVDKQDSEHRLKKLLFFVRTEGSEVVVLVVVYVCEEEFVSVGWDGRVPDRFGGL